MPTTTIRYDEDVKKQVAPLLSSMGLSINAYLNLALRQLAIQKRVPFQILSEDSVDQPVHYAWGSAPMAKKNQDGHLVFPKDWSEDDD